MNLEKIVANDTADKDLISKIYKQHIQHNIKKQTKKQTKKPNTIQKKKGGVETLNRHFSPKKTYDAQ